MLDHIFEILRVMGATLRIPASFVVIEFIGTMAFAISGIRLASAKKFDWFGAYIVGMATAIGGGTLRDVMLGIPPFWMTNSIYVICCGLALLWVILFGKRIIRQQSTWFIFDTIGLALFNIIGIEKTINMHYPLWMAVIMGSVTGAAGGVIRDILINEIPLIFRKDIYAVACILGGIIYIIAYKIDMPAEISAILSAFTVIIIRILAVKYHWQLPILKGDDNNPEQENK
ncbi:MAG TPA: trimeric intracellular cation channel family protein [Candidatus Paraprevotella stercorigallinarum]|jgi:uncharacterized membrane protein YeiH|nr:trimeric intracellular cation channel family protein [Candidatus Paraprevotella stercorigallinarum]